MNFFVGTVRSINALQLLVDSEVHKGIVVKINRKHIPPAKYNAIEKNLKKYKIVYAIKNLKAVTVDQKIQKKVLFQWKLKTKYVQTLKTNNFEISKENMPDVSEIRMFYNFLYNQNRQKFELNFPKYMKIYDSIKKKSKKITKNIKYVSYHPQFIENMLELCKKHKQIKIRYMKNYGYELVAESSALLDEFIENLRGVNRPNKLEIEL